MVDIFNLMINLFSQIIEFLDNFTIVGSLSILKILIILFIFEIALNFLIRKKKGS